MYKGINLRINSKLFSFKIYYEDQQPGLTSAQFDILTLKAQKLKPENFITTYLRQFFITFKCQNQKNFRTSLLAMFLKPSFGPGGNIFLSV
jgi:hypothetical protein